MTRSTVTSPLVPTHFNQHKTDIYKMHLQTQTPEFEIIFAVSWTAYETASQ